MVGKLKLLLMLLALGECRSGENGESNPLTNDLDSVLMVQNPPGVCGTLWTDFGEKSDFVVSFWTTPSLLELVDKDFCRVTICGGRGGLLIVFGLFLFVVALVAVTSLVAVGDGNDWGGGDDDDDGVAPRDIRCDGNLDWKRRWWSAE